LQNIDYWNCPRVSGDGSVKRYGVRPSACPILSLQQRASGLLLWARRTGDIDRLRSAENASGVTL